MNREKLAAKVAKELRTLDEPCELLDTAHPGYLKKQVQKLKADNEPQAAALAVDEAGMAAAESINP